MGTTSISVFFQEIWHYGLLVRILTWSLDVKSILIMLGIRILGILLPSWLSILIKVFCVNVISLADANA